MPCWTSVAARKSATPHSASVMIAKEAAGSRVNTRQLRSSSLRTVFFQRVAPGVVILACGSTRLRVERTRAAQRRARRSKGLRLAVDDRRGTLRRRTRSAASGIRRSADSRLRHSAARSPGIAWRRSSQDRRVVVGEIEIGELDDDDVVLPAADQRQQHRRFAGRCVGDNGDQRLRSASAAPRRRRTRRHTIADGTASTADVVPEAAYASPASGRA